MSDLDFTEFDADGLSALEKIYLFSRSHAGFHRVFIVHALPRYLDVDHVTPAEAVEYVLPLLNGLALDEDEAVKEALAAELLPIVWWFITHCRLVEEDFSTPQQDTILEQLAEQSPELAGVTPIPVQAFTPILGTLLLSQNTLVGGPARHAVVQLLKRIRHAEEREDGHPVTLPTDNERPEPDYAVGLLGPPERHLFEHEIVHSVVIGMGRLDMPDVDDGPLSNISTPRSQGGHHETHIEHHPHSGHDMRPATPPIPADAPDSTTAGSTPLAAPSSTPDSYFPVMPVAPHGTPAPSPSASPRRKPSDLPEQRDATSPMADEDDISEEAAVGRLSSMSLMAAVTASGTLKEETKTAFVTEVERVGRDPVYWVRREAAFAVGALAKVVPDELVISSLLPLFESLYQDPIWHVRHSVLFALPAILSRLPPNRRRSLALDVILPLSSDESPTVRSAVLEALGEVMHTFIDLEDGPPRELLDMFIGVRGGGAEAATVIQPDASSTIQSPISASSRTSYNPGAEPQTDVDIYDDPARPLVCAFNFPAVALTLGRSRWPELRNLYLTLSQSSSFKVRLTLAASLGEIAKIIGPTNAREDLMDVWRASISADDTEVRLKATECAAVFVRALAPPEQVAALGEIEVGVTSGKLRGWREREEVMKSLASFLDISGCEDILRRLLMQGLGDRVSAIREAAVSATPAFVKAWRYMPRLITGLREGIRALAHSDSYRERTTFVTCEQAVLVSTESDFVLFDEGFWDILSHLSRDPIVDVRIRVARLLVTISTDHVNDAPIMARALTLAERLEQDSSQDVRAFARSIRSRSESVAPRSPWEMEAPKSAITFSRPPPLAPS
ncbi:hypothetical protein POSPLADRAFT_1167264 [Postia placenta MAD-698-R-SB12]|uniref:TOG domain-containing protein n=1 Tax=Postia placenta MAD-698-R-SB12 TaxID=670580 RepID=A0A1X6N8X9_9APHY|nr:hypothetical protein POSPLADRAFT_1167264 [Postia placenta MAD-698-R-SB12]OSX65087.1 hypothetical protein POSPLADRAFT_1167264 [Postia placenta MAD-698-R-SB12]